MHGLGAFSMVFFDGVGYRDKQKHGYDTVVDKAEVWD
jgi:hypothetical protein